MTNETKESQQPNADNDSTKSRSSQNDERRMIAVVIAPEEAREIYDDLCKRWNHHTVNTLLRQLYAQLEEFPEGVEWPEE